MESEEYEQIPWAKLVADAEPTIDRRLYVVGGIVAVILAVVLIVRMSSPTPPTPVPVADALTPASVVPTQEVPPATVPTSVEAPVAVVTEADLMASIEPHTIFPNARLVVVAEWFVTDFFTRDGSSATVESLEARLRPETAGELPHHDPDQPEQFVEWAKVFSIDETQSGYDVLVAFRTVHRTDGGFVRDPVRAVAVRLLPEDESWIVAGPPTSAVAP